MSERRTKIGLACAGGVVEGAFWELGVLCALEQALMGAQLSHLDVYVGVSAGAIVASCLANGIPPHIMRRAVLQRDAPDLNLQPQFFFRPALGEWWRRVLDAPGVGLRALSRYAARPRDLTLLGVLQDMSRVLPVGLFDSSSLELYLAHVFSTFGRTDSFRELANTLRVLAVNLNTSELIAFGEQGTTHVPISRAVRASCALPLLYTPVEIEGEYYIDGVARRTLGVNVAMTAGADLLLAVNPIVPVNLEQAVARNATVHDDLFQLGLPSVLSQTFRTMVHSRMRISLQNYEHLFPGADIVLIEPEPSDPTMFFSNIFSFSNRCRVLAHAYASTCRYLRREADRLDAVLRPHGLSLCDEVLDERRCEFPSPPPEALARYLTMGEVMAEAQATLERLERTLGRLRPVASTAGSP